MKKGGHLEERLRRFATPIPNRLDDAHTPREREVEEDWHRVLEVKVVSIDPVNTRALVQDIKNRRFLISSSTKGVDVSDLVVGQTLHCATFGTGFSHQPGEVILAVV